MATIPPAALSLSLVSTIFLLQRIEVVASWAWVSQQDHHHHAGISIGHHQQQQHNRSRRHNIFLYSLGSGNSSADYHSDEEASQQLPSSSSSSGIRVNKVFKATHSRREADALIASGRVCVNGVMVDPANVGRKVLPFQDVISLDGNIIYGWEAMNAITGEKEMMNSKMDHGSHSDDDHTHSNHNNNCNAINNHQPLNSSELSSFEYIKYYKPLGVTCTTDSRIKGNIIDDLIYHGYTPRHRVYPVGRLDKETSGLILLTSDGRVVNSVLRGENKHPKVYNVMVNDSLTEEDIERLRVSAYNLYLSMMLCRTCCCTKLCILNTNIDTQTNDRINQDGIVITTVSQRKGRSIEENTLVAKTKKAIVERIGHNSCRMTLVEGRNRQIRKMMEALGLRVVRLHRVEFMGIGLTSTPSSRSSRKEENGNSRNSRVNNLAAAADDGELKRPGDWAYLDEREMNLIENAIQLARRKDENERRYI